MGICFCEAQLSPELPRDTPHSLSSVAQASSTSMFSTSAAAVAQVQRAKSQPTMTGTCIALQLNHRSLLTKLL